MFTNLYFSASVLAFLKDKKSQLAYLFFLFRDEQLLKRRKKKKIFCPTISWNELIRGNRCVSVQNLNCPICFDRQERLLEIKIHQVSLKKKNCRKRWPFLLVSTQPCLHILTPLITNPSMLGSGKTGTFKSFKLGLFEEILNPPNP